MKTSQEKLHQMQRPGWQQDSVVQQAYTAQPMNRHIRRAQEALLKKERAIKNPAVESRVSITLEGCHPSNNQQSKGHN